MGSAFVPAPNPIVGGALAFIKIPLNVIAITNRLFSYDELPWGRDQTFSFRTYNGREQAIETAQFVTKAGREFFRWHLEHNLSSSEPQSHWVDANGRQTDRGRGDNVWKVNNRDADETNDIGWDAKVVRGSNPGEWRVEVTYKAWRD